MRILPSVLRTRLAVEFLEDRTVPTTVTLSGNGVLTILGTGGNDVIQVSQAAGQLSISGVSQTFASGSVNTVVVDGGQGNDTITVSPSVTQTTYLYDGSGNDVMQGGSGVNHIFGGTGNDTLIGGSANDIIYGGPGTNTISAPAGAMVSNGSAFVTASLTAEAQQILDLTNQLRAQHGLGAVTFSAQLTAAANLQAANMVSMVPYVGFSDAMSHTLNGVDQPTLTSRLSTVGYNFLGAGENIAYGYADAASVFQAWVNSPDHLANLLNPSFTQTGIAIATTSDGVPYYAQEFGVPAANNPTGPSPINSVPVTAPPAVTPPATTPPTTPTIPTPTSGFGAGPSQAGKIYAVGTDAGSPGIVTVYDAATGAVKFNFSPYGTQFTGGVRVATGDVTGDGVPDIIVAPGAGMSSLIKIYDGVTGNLVRSFYAYNTAFTGGVNIAVGDVNGDGHLDIITGAGAGGGPHVEVFDGETFGVIRSFFAYSATFTGGVNVAAADINGDGFADIITGAGANGGPHVEVFDGATGAAIRSFMAFAPTFTGGVYVSAGDLNGDGIPDIIVSAGATGGPNVRAFDGTTTALITDFFAGSPTFTGGIRTSTLDVNGQIDLVAATGSGSDTVSVYNPAGQLLGNFQAGDPANLSGLFVG